MSRPRHSASISRRWARRSRLRRRRWAYTGVEETAQDLGAQVKETAQDLGVQVKDTMTEYYAQGREGLPDVSQTLEGQIRAQPLQALLVAGGLGILLALLTRRR